MIDLQGCITSVRLIEMTNEETGNALRMDAGRYVDREEYELAQTAILIAEYCEKCNEASKALWEGLTELHQDR